MRCRVEMDLVRCDTPREPSCRKSLICFSGSPLWMDALQRRAVKTAFQPLLSLSMRVLNAASAGGWDDCLSMTQIMAPLPPWRSSSKLLQARLAFGTREGWGGRDEKADGSLARSYLPKLEPGTRR